MKKVFYLICLSILLGNLTACKNKGCTDVNALNYDAEAKKDDGSCEYANQDSLPPITITSEVVGFNSLAKFPGIWNGPVESPTPLGSFPEWIVDFRPISGSQVSAKNELDSVNDIFMSFFICKFNNEYKVAFRNGGGFAGNVRNSYMIVDSVSETSSQSFYRFSDPISDGNRVYTNITFKQDSMIMHTYTNQFNTLSEPVTHMIWRAKLKDSEATQSATAHFNYPQKQLTKDLSTTFDGYSEAVFYSADLDPYPESEQPYVGNANVNISITNPATVSTSKKVLILVTTKKLFNGFTFIPANLASRSRYVLVGANSTTGYNFNYMHPGGYYLNAIYDEDGDSQFSSGDYMNSAFDVPLTLVEEGSSVGNVTIDFQIP